jgi:hypothetical protein
MCLGPVALAVADAALTLWGQVPEYWVDGYAVVREHNPVAYGLLRLHPVGFLCGFALWVILFTVAIHKLPSAWARLTAFAVMLGHALGCATWLVRWPFGLLAVFALLLVVRAFDTLIRQRRRQSETETQRRPARIVPSLRPSLRKVLGTLLFGGIAVWLGILGVKALYDEKEDYDRIEPGLYMGGAVEKPPFGTTAVLNLCEQPDPYQCGIHLWEPIRDGTPAPSTDWLRRMVEFVDTQRRARRTVYVHCYHGVSRSGMVVTAYVMYKNNWTRDEALEYVRSKRPMVRPNRAFMQLLLEWEEYLKQNGTPGRRQRVGG